MKLPVKLLMSLISLVSVIARAGEYKNYSRDEIKYWRYTSYKGGKLPEGFTDEKFSSAIYNGRIFTMKRLHTLMLFLAVLFTGFNFNAEAATVKQALSCNPEAWAEQPGACPSTYELYEGDATYKAAIDKALKPVGLSGMFGKGGYMDGPGGGITPVNINGTVWFQGDGCKANTCGWDFIVTLYNPKTHEVVGYTKHMLRLRRAGEINGEHVPEIILLNSHDGTSSYQMLPGYFRFVCQNGCVCGQSLGEVRVPHRGNVVEKVIEGAYEVVGVFDRIEEKRDAMQSLVLPPPARQALAQAALTYRYGDEHQPVTTADILTPRRREDYGKDLWSAYQTIQENMLKGGISGRSAKGKRIHKADRLITERLVQALGLVDIRVPDHLIVGGNQVFSFAEHGLL